MEGYRIASEEKSTFSAYLGLLILVVLGGGAIYFFMLSQREMKEVNNYDPNRPVPAEAVVKSRLSAEAYGVVREGRTQMSFQNQYWDNTRPGIYVDVITGDPLFSSTDKYDSGLGMPSFTKPISPDALVQYSDTSHDMQRTGLRAKRSNAHLGHLLADPKSPSGQNFSTNSAALNFIPLEQMKARGYEASLPLVQPK
ncbi:MAG: peptide-methionine (R)-S-oxide reductase MsrB [Verrucomicrobiota bacterium]|nr:peptide-methionine (R)-S-oxide reductase MsrB [Verrucomicrobiota bacterium]